MTQTLGEAGAGRKDGGKSPSPLTAGPPKPRPAGIIRAMSRAHDRAFLSRCAAGTVDLMDETVASRLEAVVGRVDESDPDMCELAGQAALTMERVVLEAWAQSLDLTVSERIDPAAEVQALRAIGRARTG